MTIPYYPLSDEMLKAITRLQLDRIKKRVESTHKVAFDYDDAVVDLIVSRCTETESGGRMIDTILTNSLLPDMSREFLTRMLEGKALAGVRISSRDNELHYDFSDRPDADGMRIKCGRGLAPDGGDQSPDINCTLLSAASPSHIELGFFSYSRIYETPDAIQPSLTPGQDHQPPRAGCAVAQ